MSLTEKPDNSFLWPERGAQQAAAAADFQGTRRVVLGESCCEAPWGRNAHKLQGPSPAGTCPPAPLLPASPVSPWPGTAEVTLQTPPAGRAKAGIKYRPDGSQNEQAGS